MMLVLYVNSGASYSKEISLYDGSNTMISLNFVSKQDRMQWAKNYRI